MQFLKKKIVELGSLELLMKTLFMTNFYFLFKHFKCVNIRKISRMNMHIPMHISMQKLLPLLGRGWVHKSFKDKYATL